MINISSDLFKLVLPWLLNIGYFVAVLPQIFLNFKRKSAKGLSNLYLLGYFNGYFFTLLYVYKSNFTLAYRLLVPVSFLAGCFLIFQKFLYTKRVKYIYDFLFLAFFNLLFLTGFFTFFFFYPNYIGDFAGWIASGIWVIYFLPQVFTIYKNKTVEGFSFLFISLLGIGNFLELIFAFLAKLPAQTFFTAVRGLVFYIIFCLQFWMFGKKN